ncbi:MAG: alpha/beta hydrolase [Beijerinckiaceae bacterium]
MSAVGAQQETEEGRSQPPSLLLMLAEARALQEYGASLALAPLLLTAPRGDGHPVLVLPGFLASDTSTQMLRRYLRALGYGAVGWELGRNIGGFYGMRDNLRSRLARLHNETRRKISLVGWSLGGVFARDLALAVPDAVRSVITLGSPFSGDVKATNASRLYEQVTGERHADAQPQHLRALAGDLGLPTTSIYSRTDGVVHWRTSLAKENDHTENIEILLASHTGLGFNAAALWAVADRLAQPEGTFAPFGRGGPFALAYPRRGVD